MGEQTRALARRFFPEAMFYLEWAEASKRKKSRIKLIKKACKILNSNVKGKYDRIKLKPRRDRR